MEPTVSAILSKFLDWNRKHRSPRTCEWYAGHLSGFLDHLGDQADMPVAELKPYHIVEWIDAHEKWGDNYRRGAIVAVQRAFNWAAELGYVADSPVKKIKKPPARRREIFMTPEDFEAILAQLREGDPFRDIFLFVWLTGCRPQEARHIEPRHVELERERIVFPAEESKGKRAKRVIYLHGVSLEMVTRLVAEGREGKLFLNSRGQPWTKYALCNRFYRISQKLGKRLFCYAARHGFCERKLLQGHGVLTVAHLLGHADGTMVSKVYSHLDKEDGHLRKALKD